MSALRSEQAFEDQCALEAGGAPEEMGAEAERIGRGDIPRHIIHEQDFVRGGPPMRDRA